MYYSHLLTTALFPLLVLANPVPALTSSADLAERAGLVRRAVEYCKIVNVDDFAYCRSGPHTSSPWVAKLYTPSSFYVCGAPLTSIA